MFDHFLITRFNVKLSIWEVTHSGKEVRTNEWMEHRFNLFEKFTLPSVLNQTNNNFRWLIYFDKNTSEKYRKKALLLEQHHFNISVYFITGMDVFLPEIISAINNLRDYKNNFLITTRLDNDDLIHKNFIKTIQESFIPENGTLIDLRRGYQLNLQNNKITIRHFFQHYSCFLSLIEDVSSFKTVFSRRIEDWTMEKKILIHDFAPLFIESVHGENLVNSPRSYMPYLLRFSATDFGIDYSVLKFPNLIWIIYKNRKYYYKRIRIALKKKIPLG